MFNRLLRIWQSIVRVEETQGVLLWLLSPLGGSAAMISAYVNDLPWYQILFWGAGVFAFLIHGLFQAWQWRQRTTVFEKLRLENAIITDVVQPSEDSPIFGIATQYLMHNAADVPVYFELVRAAVSIEGAVNAGAPVERGVYVLQPHSNMNINAAAIHGLRKKEQLAGTASFSIAYGTAKDTLRYVLDHDGALTLYIVPHPQIPRQIATSCSFHHKKITHTMRLLD
jgi:hypothetical protein